VAGATVGSGSKNTTSEKVDGFGPHPPPELPLTGVAADPVADLTASESVTRVTPRINRRRDIKRDTSSCVAVQPASSKAGAVMSPRRLPLEEPAAPAPGLVVADSELSEVLAGTTRDRSESACCQLNRPDAISLTVWTRASASLANWV
jgi:hypothetical protein